MGIVGIPLLLGVFAVLSGVGVVAQKQVVPEGISAVNGSSTEMGCTGREQDGSHTLCDCSYLIDGVSPDIDTSSSNWASQLVTVRSSEANANIIIPHVLLTFGFDTPVSVTGIEIDLFNCPDWNIGATSVQAYFNTQYDLSLDISSVQFAAPVPLSQSSCNSLSTVTISSLPGGSFRTIYVIAAIESSSIEWAHVGEVRFSGINNLNCPLPNTSIPPNTHVPIFSSAQSTSTSQTMLTSTQALVVLTTATYLSSGIIPMKQTSTYPPEHSTPFILSIPPSPIPPTTSTSVIQSKGQSIILKSVVSSNTSSSKINKPDPMSSKTMISSSLTASATPPGREDQSLFNQTTTILTAAIIAALLVLVLLTLVCLIYFCVSRRKRQTKSFSRINRLNSNTGSIVPSSTNPTLIGLPSPLHEQYSAGAVVTKSDTHYEAFVSRHRKEMEGLEYSYAYVSLSEAKTKVRYSAAIKYDYVGTPSWSLRQPDENLVPKKVEAPVAPSLTYSNIPYAASPSCVPRLEVSDGESFPFSPDEVVISEFINPLDFTCVEDPTELRETPTVYGPVYPNLDPLPGSLPPLRVSNDNVFEIDEGIGDFGSAVLAVTEGLSLKDLRLSKDNNNRDLSILLALKKLSPLASDDEREAFNREVEFMYRVKHPNIAQFIGVCYEDPTFLMMEYMEEGDLYQFLHRYTEVVPATTTKEDQIPTPALLFMATQIASGMAYLAGMKFVHRDLATRKCFVGNNFGVKLADFGTNTRYRSHYYSIRGNILMPIRWMATECFYGKFSEKADVWAFGVTMWELFTIAQEAPYCNLTDEEVVKNSLNRESLQLLPKPASCPSPAFKLMKRCWEVESKERPTFQEIEHSLKKLDKGP